MTAHSYGQRVFILLGCKGPQNGICSCRDRKRAKHEANEAIVKVSEQLKDAQFLKEEGDNLQTANRQMREALRAREAEIARVR